MERSRLLTLSQGPPTIHTAGPQRWNRRIRERGTLTRDPVSGLVSELVSGSKISSFLRGAENADMPEDFLERLRSVVGARELTHVTSLDPAKDLDLERTAELLLRRFHKANDVRAYELLVDLAAVRLADLAAQIARDLGLVDDPDELVVAFYEHLFVDVSSDGHRPPDTRFLARADAWMRECAESRVRDIALSSASDPAGAVHWGADGRPTVPSGSGAARTRATRVCFHRLDLPLRRALRARQVEDLAPSEIAEQFALSVQEVNALLLEALDRLDRAVEKELEGGSP